MAMCLPRRGSVPLVQLSRFPALNDRLYIYAECASVTRCMWCLGPWAVWFNASPRPV